jgi:hypothetical protein
MRALRSAPLVAGAALLVACGGVQVRPDAPLPRALVQPMAARTGLILNDELRHYKHEETRAGANWSVDLGAGHEQLFRAIFAASFTDSQVYQNQDAARAADARQVLFEPGIEQYSFATARETSGAYWAVTIRYRIAVLTPQGEPVDALTLTGYGSAAGDGGAGKSLIAATRSAMRDAAAKFLLQMPRQPVAVKLAAGEVIAAGDKLAVTIDAIEAVPLEPDAGAP